MKLYVTREAEGVRLRFVTEIADVELFSFLVGEDESLEDLSEACDIELRQREADREEALSALRNQEATP